MRHIGDHRHHVIPGTTRPDESRSEYNGEILRFHLIDLAVLDDFLQMKHEMFQGLKMMLRKIAQELPYRRHSPLRILDLVSIDKHRIQIRRQQRIRKLTEEGLE